MMAASLIGSGNLWRIRMRFAHKTCLVTGDGSRIGRSACNGFAAGGGRVVVVDNDKEHRCRRGFAYQQ
jgi:NAD(P)-dependent dehydrogenase (short-subunit alcohol dehydrogenase family)